MKFILFLISCFTVCDYVLCLPLETPRPDVNERRGNSEYVDSKTKEGDTALHLSIKRGYHNITRLLLERGANINSKDQDGNTPTHKAVLFNYPNILKMLIRRKADINIPNDDGEIPLLIAVTNEYLDLVQILVEGNAIINCCNKTYKNPLAVAIREDNTEILKLFFDKGVKANDKIGGAPLLQLAVLNASVNVTRFLLEHGADYTFKTEDGETLLYLAIYNDFTNLAELILTVTTVAPPPNGLQGNVFQRVRPGSLVRRGKN